MDGAEFEDRRLDEAAKAYEIFNARKDNVVKVLLKPCAPFPAVIFCDVIRARLPRRIPTSFTSHFQWAMLASVNE